MKNIIFLFLLFVGVMSSSCTDTMTTTTGPSPIYSQISFDSLSDSNNQFSGRPEGPKDTTKKDTSFGKRDTVRKQPIPTPFVDLIVRLNITSDQRPMVERLLSENRKCTEGCISELKKSEFLILESARQRESDIKNAVRTGKISKVEARERLSSLRKSVNDSIRNNPVRQATRDCVKSCADTFLESLQRILTPEQIITLKKWLDDRSKRQGSVKRG